MLGHFIVPVSWAMILVYVSWPLHCQIEKLFVGRQALAALTTTLLLTSLIVIPLVWASFLLQAEIVEIYHNLPALLDQKPALPEFALRIPYLGKELGNLFGQVDSLRELLRMRVLPWLRQYSGEMLNVLGDVGYNAAKLGFALLTAFFLYRDGPEVTGQVRKVLRMMLGERLNAYIATTEETLKAVVYGIVLTAIAQGVLAGLGYWFVGLGTPILLCVVTIFFAMIPFGTLWYGSPPAYGCWPMDNIGQPFRLPCGVRWSSVGWTISFAHWSSAERREFHFCWCSSAFSVVWPASVSSAFFWGLWFWRLVSRFGANGWPAIKRWAREHPIQNRGK